MKKIIKIGIICLVTVMTLTGCSCTKQESKKETEKKLDDTISHNENQGIVENKQQNGLTFTNTDLQVSDAGSTLITQVTNTTNESIELNLFNIILKDKNGKVLVTLKGTLGESIDGGQSKTLTTASDMNLKDAYTVEYELINE